MLEVAERLRQRVEALGIAVQVYGLDRQLWPYELQGAWQAVPYSMPWRRTGQTGSQGGTRPLFELPASPFATYTMRADPQASIDIDVAGVVVPETQEARQKRRAKARAAYERARKRVEEQAHVLDEDSTARNKRAVTCAKKALAKAQSWLEQARSAKPLTTLCYAINQVTHWSLKRIYWAYRGRLGIESSSRQSRQARLFTTRRQAWFRLLSFGLSMILRNLWLAVRWLLGEPKRGRGGRKIAKTLLPFPMFLRWLVSALWKALRFTTWISPQAELPNPLWGIS